jgi:hypothetical protein
MANWSNVRLLIAGRRSDVLCFSRLALARPSAVFESDMLAGEAQELFSERAERLDTNRLSKVYKFQVRNGDGIQHFRRVSRQHPALCFVLTYGDPNFDDYGSYFIFEGRVRKHNISNRRKAAVMASHGVTGKDDVDDVDDDWRFWEASRELMDLAEAHWQPSVLRAIAPIRPQH